MLKGDIITLPPQGHRTALVERILVWGRICKFTWVDGTYELFRHFYAVPSARDDRGREVGAVRGVLWSLLGMLNSGSTHLAVLKDARSRPMP